MDIILAFFVIFSYYLLFLKIFKDKKNLEILYGLSFAFALLTKGPVSFIWFWAVPLFYGIFEKEKRVFKFLFNPLNLIFSFLPVLLWLYILYSKLGLEPFHEIFQRQTLGRIKSSFAHKRPVYYYLYILPLSFFPYTFFLPFSILRQEKFKGKSFFFLWFLVPFIIFSLISGKLSIYLLPLSFPLSFYISKFLLSEKFKLKIILSIISILFIIIGFFIYKNILQYTEISLCINSIEVLFLWISLTFLLFFFKNKNLHYFFSIFSLIFCLLLSLIFYPLTYNISFKEISLKYKYFSKNDKTGYSFWDVKPSFLYYSKKKFIELHKNEEVEEKLKEGKFIIIREKNFNKLPKELKEICKINFKQERLGEDFLIISIPSQKQKGH
jgi:4-amino-4-deoxy-L-arabinose transferase-like glycosyltransferase